MENCILEARDLEFFYPDGTHALKKLNMKILEGKKIAIVGVNGSGKSTLFLNFNGVLRPTSGKIIYRGKEVTFDKKSLMNLRKNVGIVFQNPETMIFSSSVYQEVSFGVMNLGIEIEEAKERVETSIKEVNMEEYQDKSIHFLSYGQKKRVSIADITAMKPEIIIFDEPTSSLDPRHSKEIIELFEKINNENITVIVSTHDIDFAYSWADYVFVLKDGKVRSQGIPEDVFSKNEIIEECYLEKPFLLETFQKLKEKNLIKDIENFPKTRKELYDLIK